MTKYDIALRLGIFGFVAMLVFAVSINFVSSESVSRIAHSGFARGLAIVLTIVVSGCGGFLWFTGFKRFKHQIGHYGIKWLMYAACTIFSGFYMQYRYGSNANS